MDFNNDSLKEALSGREQHANVVVTISDHLRLDIGVSHLRSSLRNSK
jgi:hypothetical protein